MSCAAMLRASATWLALFMACAVAQAEDVDRQSPVSLRRILEYADKRAPSIAIARAQMELGQAEVQASKVVLEDNLELGGALGPRTFDGGKGLDAQAWIKQPIEVAGERRQRRKAAQRVLSRVQRELEEVRWSVHQEVHAAFHRALVAREARDVLRKLLASTEELSSVAESRLRAGDISTLAVSLAKGELAQARQEALTAEQAYRTAQFDLATLSGWRPEDPPEVAGELDEPKKAPPIEQLLAVALGRHPGIETRASAVAEAEARLDLEDRKAWPRPTLGLSYAREAAPAFESSQNIVLGTISISLPTSQRNQGARARARANLVQRQAEQHAFQSVLRVQLVRAASAVDADADRIAAYGTEILPAFEGNLALLRRAFELGEVDLLQVVVARERLLKIQRDALSAYQDYYRDVAALEAAVGVELWQDEHEPHVRRDEALP